ncbi:MAG TPA: guanosine monophosphate reductase [Candidatus Dormibacteraeota bacterium]|nr:guanosine monophosphate reductase [Candidatus Dormibacteraeota bacterium]
MTDRNGDGLWPPAFDFDEISIVPRVASTLLHRAEADPAVRFGPVTLSVPLIASPMPDVCGSTMARALATQGALGLLHRFCPVEAEVAEFECAVRGLAAVPGPVGAAVGVTGDFLERFDRLYEAGCRIFCLDTANGAHVQVARAIERIRAARDDVFLVAGNVASAETFRWLEEAGADAIRVGIAGGSVCETRTETGVFVPTPYAVADAARVRRRALIVGDGGVRKPADMCKLLALGADVVMVGSALAGTDEAPGRVIVVEGKKFKIMRGAASFSVQQELGRSDPEYIEGAETLVPYRGPAAVVLQRYLAGLRSSMSYLDARTLDEYRRRATFVLHR